jgi:hypothetical protein
MSTARHLVLCLLPLLGISASLASAQELPTGCWSADRVQPILDSTLEIRLDPDLSALSSAERSVVRDLLEAGEILHRLYLESRHRQAISSRADLLFHHREGHARDLTSKLLDLFWLFKGPVATTLDNRREPFLPVNAEPPGKNVYPWGIDRAEIDAFVETHPDSREELLAPRTVVRRASSANLTGDLAALEKHPGLELLHPGLQKELEGLSESPTADRLYAVPYAVAYADDLILAYRFLRRAANTARDFDLDLASYLAARARDLLANDYEAGDAAWVSGRFGRLNAQIGSYETYDDELLGVKTFFSLSLLLEDEERTSRLRRAMKGLQALEDRLPYTGDKRVREDIPVGVYQVIADFGQARGTNTATILPNDSDHARKYGRTILMRHNILAHPDLFRNVSEAWAAAVAPEHLEDLTLGGRFQRTLWHEVGHYLGPDRDRQGRTLDRALAEYSDLIEELKADLVSLFSLPYLLETGYLSTAEQRAVYADGILRTLQRVEPRRGQPYQTMQLMQMNFFLERGLLSWDPETGRLAIDYDRYPETVEAMLARVLAIQQRGDAQEASFLVDRYARWDRDLHEPLAASMRAAARHRYRLVRYGALESGPPSAQVERPRQAR